jgi:16S rRNA G527 N7-methylase RsmG
MSVNYEGCKILIRPFIFSEIVMVSGLWEIYVKSVLYKEVKNDDAIVDVGANIGVYAIPLAKRVSKVIAIEPHAKTSEMLEKSIELNQLHNIVLVKKMIGESKKKYYMVYLKFLWNLELLLLMEKISTLLLKLKPLI